jgi:hypothetical protein
MARRIRRNRPGLQRQPRIVGVQRIPRGSGLLPILDKKLTETVDHFNVSRSFVIAVALADYFGVPIERFEGARRAKK